MHHLIQVQKLFLAAVKSLRVGPNTTIRFLIVDADLKKS